MNLQLEDGRPIHITRDTGFTGIESIMTRAEAFSLIERAKDKTAADWLSWMHLGQALHITGNSKEGLKAACQALKMFECSATFMNVAVILECFGRFDEAMQFATWAHERDKTNQFAGLLLAQAHLRRGEWADSWAAFEYYCWGRIWEIGLEQYIQQWQGEPLAGKKILVLQGGGFGDNLMFMRWIFNLKNEGAHVTYACPDVMVPLLKGHPWIDELMPTHEDDSTEQLPEVDIYVEKDGVQQFDYFAPIMGLARRCLASVEGTEVQSKTLVPYIKADPRDLGPKTKPRVGICWAGAEKLDPRRHRSLNLDQVEKLLTEVKGVEWVNLQYGGIPPISGVMMPEMQNWRDTAEVVAALDLVVTVDTGVMHLAGAMSKKTWVLLPGLSDWKFLLGRSDSPFYPSLRLFRNRGEGLQDALEQVIAALAELR